MILANWQLPQDDSELDKVIIPATCPGARCHDQIPAVDNNLRSLFRRYHNNIRIKGLDSGQCFQDEIEICIYIRGAVKALKARAYATDKGWPTDIDFNNLPDRVMKFKEDLHRLIFVEGLKSDDLPLAQFMKILDTQYPNGKGLGELTSKPAIPVSGGIFQSARPG